MVLTYRVPLHSIVNSMAETGSSVNALLRQSLSEPHPGREKLFSKHDCAGWDSMKDVQVQARKKRPLSYFLTRPLSSIINNMEDTSRALRPDCSIMTSIALGS